MFEELRLIPGVNSERTPTLNQAGIVDAQFIRWKEGLPEKLGGWGRFYPFSVNTLPRALQAWEDLDQNLRLAIGGTTALLVLTGGVLTNITPQTTITNNAPNFSTINGQAVVTIVDAGDNNANANMWVFIATPVSIGGLVLSGIYPITQELSSTSYTITASQNATATVNNAGAVPSYATQSGSSTVTVTLNNHGFVAGQTFVALISTTIGGVTIFGNYVIQSATTNTFTISAAQQATSTTSGSENGGNVNITYYVAISPQAAAGGWGIGTWGGGGWGTGTSPPQPSGTPIMATDWSLLNFGEDLIANPAGQPLYQWGPETGAQIANIIGQGPIIADGCFLSQPEQIVVAWGASFNGAPAPLRLAWSDAGNFLQWTPTTTNFAGGFTISTGTAIISCVQGANQFTVHTDVGVWSGNYIGQPLVFAILEVMKGCGLIGRKALGVANNTIYWMSQAQFFQMPSGGVPAVLPCHLWDQVFKRIDTTNWQKVRFFANSLFNEIGWYFPILSSLGGTGENSWYVKYNTVEQEWDAGPMGRSAWIDQSILGPPIGTTTSGLVYQHEISPDADGVAMNPYIQTADFAISQGAKGEEFGFVDYCIPDAIYGYPGFSTSASLLWTFQFKAFPNDTPQTSGPFMSNNATKFIEPRGRARHMSLRVESQDLGSFWRLGLPRYRVQPDGRNP